MFVLLCVVCVGWKREENAKIHQKEYVNNVRGEC